jgi:fatty acid desaturase 2 (delta-6 desaturase)
MSNDNDNDNDAPARPRDTITIDNKTYDITNFNHPGGSIINYVKNTADATDVFREFHHRSSDRVNKVLQSLPTYPESAPSPPPRVAPEHVLTDRQKEMTADFREMREKLVKQGLFEPDYIHVYFRLLEIAFYFGMGAWLASYNIYASMLSFIVFKTRCGWIQHEGGHVSLTGNKGIDRAIQSFTMGFGNGVSGVLTNITHFRHHATPQKIKHDMDMDTTPLVAFFNQAFEKSYHSKTTTRYMNRWWMRFQAWTFLPIVNGILVHLFWVYYLFPKKVFQRWCRAKNVSEHTIMSIEAFSMLAHHLIMPLIFYNGGVSGGGIAWCYFLLMVTNFCEFIYLFGHFTLSHSYMDVIPENKHLIWFEYALHHTVNISTKSALVSWIMGYLNFQIEHHLFPSMPQYKNALAAPYVRAFCEKWSSDLKYTEHSYKDAWRLMLSNLDEVGKHYYENGISHEGHEHAE